jgi:hypothetical protein
MKWLIICVAFASLIAGTPAVAGREHLNRYGYTRGDSNADQGSRPNAVNRPLNVPQKVRRPRHLRRL